MNEAQKLIFGTVIEMLESTAANLKEPYPGQEHNGEVVTLTPEDFNAVAVLIQDAAE